MGEDESLPRVGLVTAEEALDPVELCRALVGVMGADVAVVEGVSQCVLGDDVEVAAVEVGITLGFLKAFPKDHVGRDEAPGIRAPEDEAVLGQINQHVVSIHPAEPVIALGTLG